MLYLIMISMMDRTVIVSASRYRISIKNQSKFASVFARYFVFFFAFAFALQPLPSWLYSIVPGVVGVFLFLACSSTPAWRARQHSQHCGYFQRCGIGIGGVLLSSERGSVGDKLK